MKRRGFLKRLGIGVMALTIASNLVLPSIKKSLETEAIDTFIKNMKRDGIWDKTDAIYLFAFGSIINLKA